NFPLTANFNMNAFPIIFLISLGGSILGSLLTKKEDDETLKKFYKQVRPWGFWGPVKKLVKADDPSFQANKDFPRDMFNVVTGIVWQIALMAFPVFLIIREWKSFTIAIAIAVATTIVLKFSWWDRLKD
ncbi:MAG TPA: sodium:solute symporter, partial [Bacteroidales bacterium]|nr:sodium:solute symporter [Bacteroidales bacterium]